MMNGNQDAMSVCYRFNVKLERLRNNIQQVAATEGIPPWFVEILQSLETFTNDFSLFVKELDDKHQHVESELAVVRAVSDGLESDRVRLQQEIEKLQADLEDHQQYSRRTNILIHGCDEEPNENIEEKVLDILSDKDKMDLPISRYEIGRTHRLGPKHQGKKRPIIVRFISNRQKELVYANKKKLKGTKLLITENLTKQRYDLLKSCWDDFGRENVWTYDCRIYISTGNVNQYGRKERLVVTRKEDLFGQQISGVNIN